jgi:RHS repeat-associated protein
MFGSRSSSNSGKGTGYATGYVQHNKVIVFEDKRYQYDAFGRLSEKRSSKHGLQTFAYDAEHRLIQVTKHESTGYKKTSTQTTKFTYDALGRRISKTHSTGDAYSPETKTTFCWDGLRLLSETTQTVRGDKTSLYIYADSESYEPLARVDTLDGKENTIDSIAAQAMNTPANDDSIDENSSNNPPKPKIFHFHNDLNGLPQELSTEGEFVWKATYKVWGNVATEEWTGEYEHAQQLGETQNLRFQGQYYDQETGLHYNTFRFFDPDVGRFTTTDPIGLAGGSNLYKYAPNPIGWIDPLGLTCGAPVHHIASNKSNIWSNGFRDLFRKYGMGKFKNGKERSDVLNDPLNKIAVPGHYGPHPPEMHREIYTRLNNAGIAKGETGFRAELEALRKEAVQVGTRLNQQLTRTGEWAPK